MKTMFQRNNETGVSIEELRSTEESSAELKTVWTSFEKLQLAVILEDQ
jgi:hypothetical protein